MLPFLPSVTTQDGSIPLPSKDWLDSASLATAWSKISQSPLFLSSIEIHTFTGSFPRAFKFTHLLTRKNQKPKTQTKKAQNNSPLDLVFLFRGLLLFFPISRQPSLIAVYIYCLLFLTPPIIAHRISPQLQWNCSLNSWNDVRSPTGIFRLHLSYFWAFNILEHLTIFFKNSLPLAFVMPTPLIDNLAFPISHSQLSLLVPPSLLDYYTFVFQALDFILPTLFLRDLMNSQISDTIYVQNSLQIFIFSQGRLRNSRRFCSNMYFLLTQMPNSHSKTMCI